MTDARLGLNIDSRSAVVGVNDLDNLAASARRTEQAVDRLATGATQDLNRIKTAGTQAAASADRMSSSFAMAGRGQIQNVAFQVGDFATQVGAGTSASVALGQQLPQLLGGFGALGAVLGAVVAIGVPLAASFFRSADGAEAFGEASDDAAGSAQGLFDLIQSRAETIEALTAQFGGAADAALRLADAQIMLGNAVAQADLNSAIAEFDRFWERTTFGVSATTQVEELTDALGISVSEAYRLRDTFQELGQARGVQEQAMLLQSIVAQIESATAEGAEFTEEGARMAAAILSAAEAATTLAGNTDQATTAAMRARDAYYEFADAIRLANAQQAARLADATAGPASTEDPRVQGVTGQDWQEINAWRRDQAGKAASRGGGGGGGGGRSSAISEAEREAAAIQRVVQSLQDEIAMVGMSDLARETHQQLRAAGVSIYSQQGQEIADLVDQLYNLEQAEKAAQTSGEALMSAAGDIASAMGQFGGESFRAAKIFGAAIALINTYQGASEALKLPFPANLAAAGSVLAAGLGFVASIKSAQPGGGGSGSRGRGRGASSAAAAPAAAPQAPLRVFIQDISPDSLISGAALQSLFDKLLSENKDRGYVLQVAR
jgi:hypothetical protein